MGSLEERGLVHAGLARIIPPPEWFEAGMPQPTLAAYQGELDRFTIQSPIMQNVVPQGRGAFRVLPEVLSRQYLSVADFQARAATMEGTRTRRELDAIAGDAGTDEMERSFWRNLTFHAPTYGADTPGTLFPKHVSSWNLARLPGLLSAATAGEVAGVTSSYLYVGMWKAFFAWHIEDMDLYSINYVHAGAPKFWYVVPPASAHQFETLAQVLMPFEHKACPQFLRHKQVQGISVFLSSTTIVDSCCFVRWL